MKVKLYRLQTLVNKDLYDRANALAKSLGISQGELVRQAVLLYLNIAECSKDKDKSDQSVLRLLKLLLEK